MNTRVVCIGLNYRTAPVGLRERLSLSETDLSAAFELGKAAGFPIPLAELLILSTCNRIEIYAVQDGEEFGDLNAYLASICHISLDEVASHLYHYIDKEAIHHLLQVAAGLDSPSLGEPQILGQVTRAIELAQEHAAAGPILTRLFQQAIHAGKRARTETSLARRPGSLSALIASLGADFTPDLAQARIVVLGAGEMADFSVEALRKRKAEHILILDRNIERAGQLARRWKAQAGSFRMLAARLKEADILITSVSSSRGLVSFSEVQTLIQTRPDRPLLVIDLAVPRNVDPAAAQLPGVYLYDIDDLNRRLEEARAGREQEIPKVEAILADEELECLAFLDSLQVIPLIVDLRRKAEAIRAEELQRTLRHLPDLSEAEQARISDLTQAIVNKLLHSPITHLKEMAGRPDGPDFAAWVGELFDLGGSFQPPSFLPPVDVPLDDTDRKDSLL